MITYRCYDILTERNETVYACVVTVPVTDMTEAIDRQEHRMVISGALENLVGPVERFSYEPITIAEIN